MAKLLVLMILILAASNGKNLELAQQIMLRAEGLGLDAELLDLTEVDLPLFTPQKKEEGMPAQLQSAKQQFARAQAMFFCAPEYNGSIPPVLSNIIAWLSVDGKDFRTLFNGKPLGIATHSGGAGQKVLTSMRIQFSHLGANVIGREILTNSKKAMNPDSVDSILKQLDRLSA